MRATFLALLFAAVGCSNSDPCAGQSGVCIGLRVVGDVGTLDQLSVGLDMPTAASQSTPQGSFTLPVKLPLLLPAGSTGPVQVAVDGLRGGFIVAHGDGTATLSASGKGAVTVTLIAVSGGGDGGDMSDNPDLFCAAGTQDNDHDGVCTADCTTAALSCATHQVCSDATGTALCACAPGYVSSGGNCTWGSVPADPTFENKPAGAWTLGGGVTLDPTVQVGGMLDPGVIVWDKTAICTGGGFAKQTINMPPYAAAEPLSLNLSAQQTCSNSMFCGGESAVAVRINGAPTFLPTSGAFVNTKLCLGEKAYGGMFDLVLKPWDKTVCGGAMVTAGIQIDHLSIEPDATCPAPGTVLNGTFAAATGWTGIVSGGATAGIANVGPDGGPAAQLKETQTCQNASIQGLVSAASSGPGYLAISVDVKGPGGSTLTLFGPKGKGSFQQNTPPVIGTVDGNFDNAYHTAKICVPDWMKGVASPVTFVMPYSGGGTCATATGPFEWDFDNVKIVTDGSCVLGGVSDGGFERNDLGKVWQLVSDSTHQAYVSISASSVEAHSGNGSLKFTNSQNCGNAAATSTLTVPPSSGANGPALKFFYKLPLATSTSYSVSPGGPLPPQANYTERVICLDPSLVGEAFVLGFRASSSGSSCVTTYPLETLSVDDVTVGTDATCPAM
ncbi:MAG: hypothetical protein JWN44_1699 [Myxococcales bacterium]|nr:hypothetical protein [Myxococcales bacterium]